MLTPLKLIIADSHRLYRKTLTQIIAQSDGWQLSGTAATTGELLQLVQQLDPQLVLMEMRLPAAGDGIEMCRQLRLSHPHVGIIIITSCGQKPLMRQMLDAGAQGFLLKNKAEEEEILLAMRLVAAGGTYYCKEFTPLLTGDRNRCTLNEEQQQLVRLICEDNKTLSIASEFCRTHHAINKRRMKLMQDCGANSLIGLVQYALKSGLIDWSHLME